MVEHTVRCNSKSRQTHFGLKIGHMPQQRIHFNLISMYCKMQSVGASNTYRKRAEWVDDWTKYILLWFMAQIKRNMLFWPSLSMNLLIVTIVQRLFFCCCLVSSFVVISNVHLIWTGNLENLFRVAPSQFSISFIFNCSNCCIYIAIKINKNHMSYVKNKIDLLILWE